MGVNPVRMQSASWKMVRCALAILKVISLCTLTYLALLHSFLMDSIHTGAACSSCGSIAPLYIVFSASCFSPQLIVADLDNAFISLVHQSVMHALNYKSRGRRGRGRPRKRWQRVDAGTGQAN